ncbi:Phosducin thioredoxin-like domain [Trinorchestia longiramus]|nr:Phosducin thioredoxin-like domain [Trinorchestia longiramus]
MFGVNVMAWNGGDLEKLEVLQNRVGRLALGALKWTVAEALRGDLGWSLFSERMVKAVLNYKCGENKLNARCVEKDWCRSVKHYNLRVFINTRQTSMSTLDDRILGEKLQYYCSSSEDEEVDQSDPEDDDGDAEASGGSRVVQDASVNCASQELRPWEGSSTNTGPKGVLKDWRNFKQMETEKRKEKEKERLQLAKKLALTCRSTLDDEKAEAAKTESKDEVDSMLDAAVLESYIAQRMQEMMEHAMVSVGPKFGRVVQLRSTDQFLKEVDEEAKKVTVIIHIYRKVKLRVHTSIKTNKYEIVGTGLLSEAVPPVSVH